MIKADVGSAGGHLAPSRELLQTIQGHLRQHAGTLLCDRFVGHTGDDVALLLVHTRGAGDEAVHQLAWDAFLAGTAEARRQGLSGAGQDLLKSAFAGDLRGLGPAVAELELEERPSEPVLFVAADKTDPGAFNLPLYLAFADPMNTPGLILSPKLGQGFRFVVMDISSAEVDRVLELVTPEELYDLATLLRDTGRYVVESIWSRATGEQAAVVSTSRRHNIGGRYSGKDDPVMLVRSQMNFPTTGEILAPYQIGHFVAGCMRGAHQMPLMPVRLGSSVSFFDGPPVVSCAAFSLHDGRLTGPTDAFDHPFWDTVRHRVAEKAMEMRRQGFAGAAMLPTSEIECTGLVDRLDALEKRFQVRARC